MSNCVVGFPTSSHQKEVTSQHCSHCRNSDCGGGGDHWGHHRRRYHCGNSRGEQRHFLPGVMARIDRVELGHWFLSHLELELWYRRGRDD